MTDKLPFWYPLYVKLSAAHTLGRPFTSRGRRVFNWLLARRRKWGAVDAG